MPAQPSPAHASRLRQRPFTDSVTTLIKAGIDPVLARIFAARGVTSAAETNYALSGLPHYSLLKNINTTADRLLAAIQNHEKIVVVADYDVDGATACAVALRGIRALGGKIDFIVPNRFEHGYGLTPEVLDAAQALSPQLLLTVDNGIASVAAARLAKERSIDLLITDHHLPGNELPDTPYIVNPNQPGCDFPSKNLAGVGVMFYVLMAVRARMRERGLFNGKTIPNLAELLDFVALGTVADVVTLDLPNRIFVDHGLRRMRSGHLHAGIRALFSVSARRLDQAHTFDLGFAIAPRLNAAGRLADMSVGVRCLMSDDHNEAMRLALELDTLNRERRAVELDIQQEALDELAQTSFDVDNRCTLCVARPEWHTGVIGIVASRLKDKFNRPTIVFGSTEDSATGSADERQLRGSGRSIPGLHLRDALDLVAKRAPQMLSKFGGHAMAAGLTLYERDLAAFAALFETVVSERVSPEQLARVIETDGALTPGAITLNFAEVLREQVWGQNFPSPSFDNRFIVIQQQIIKDRHSRLVLRLGEQNFNAMCFNDIRLMPHEIHAAYRLDINTYQGIATLQLLIEHWWESGDR